MATRKRKSRRKSKRKRVKRSKNLVGGSFSETGSMISHFFNKAINTFTVPSPQLTSGDPRVTSQFI
jgi:hypothetical protein